MPQKDHVRTELLNEFLDFRIAFGKHIESDGVLHLTELRLEKMVLELQRLVTAVHGTTDVSTHIDNRGGLTKEGQRKLRELAQAIAAIEEDITYLTQTIDNLATHETPVIDITTYRTTREPQSIA